MAGVLEGLRVLDFGRYIAGPYCATLLAEYGADVIRIEKLAGSEDRFQAPLTETQDGGLFMQMNRNKRGVTLNPMKPEGQEIVRKLVATADVVVANLPPQTLAANWASAAAPVRSSAGEPKCTRGSKVDLPSSNRPRRRWSSPPALPPTRERSPHWPTKAT